MPARLRILLGMLFICSAFVVGALQAPAAQARVVFLGGDTYQTGVRNPVIWVEHIQRRWFYVELYDGSEWMVTRCPYEDSLNCYWNAKARGDGKGRSFVRIGNHRHWVDYRFQP